MTSTLSEKIESLMTQSMLHNMAERHDEALTCLDEVLAIQPDFLSALFNKGTLLSGLSRFEEAADCFETLLTARPDLQEIAILLNDALSALSLQYAATLDDSQTTPQHRAEVAFKLGRVLLRLERFEEALSSLEQCLELEPNHAEALNLYGNALVALGRFAEALESYQKLLLILPDNAVAAFNHANVLQKSGLLDEAIDQYQKIVAREPDFAEATIELSHCHLRLGNYERGWQLYESRWNTRQFAGRRLALTTAEWQGQDVQSLLVWAEQGLGDTIQFARYVPLLKPKARHVIFRVPATLVSLMKTLDADVTVISEEAPLPAHDAHIPLMSLPLLLQGQVREIPASIPYLHAPPEKAGKWQHVLSRCTRPKVGIAWVGKQTGAINHSRDMRVAELVKLTELDIEVIGLQKELPACDIPLLTCLSEQVSLGESLEDFSDTAALIAQLDLVVSVDTAVAHLAGALGKPVYLMLRSSGEWRWLEGRDDSPWYPAHRIFRQAREHEWSDVVEAIAGELSRRYITE